MNSKKLKKTDTVSINTPDNLSGIHIDALFFAQQLEFMLYVILKAYINSTKVILIKKGIKYEPYLNEDWGCREYINRIKTFYPQKNHINFYSTLEKAVKSRNKFIHQGFLDRSDPLTKLSLSRSDYYSNPKSLKMAKEFISDYEAFVKNSVDILDNVNKAMLRAEK